MGWPGVAVRGLARVGRRGAFLLFLALLDVLYGYSLLVTPPQGPGLHLVLSLDVWGWCWVATGIALLLGAFVKRDRVFFALAAFIKSAWAGAWVSVWVADDFYPRAWVSVLIWAAFAAAVLVVASWPEVVSPTRDQTYE